MGGRLVFTELFRVVEGMGLGRFPPIDNKLGSGGVTQ
jgi:hypothetical protein